MDTRERIISPRHDDLDTSRHVLERGEKIVLDLFNRHLDPEWEIYVQPHLNGLRPDFVLLHPDVGIAVYEVKDWDLDSVDFFEGRGISGQPELFGRRNGKQFRVEAENPVTRVWNYRQEIMNLYCPRLERRAGLAAITAGVILPFADEYGARTLFQSFLAHRKMDRHPRYAPLVGRQSIVGEDLQAIFPEANRKSSHLMTPELAQDLRHWLIDPELAEEQRSELQLDAQQEELATTRTDSGFRRVRGPAGSGKSLVLAAKAAELARVDKDVLVVTFNITLRQYLQDLAVRWKHTGGQLRKTVTWLNFHHWCKRVCFEAGRIDEYSELWRRHFGTSQAETEPVELGNASIDIILSAELVTLVGNMIDDPESGPVSDYDAILVDEGQDFRPEWWNALRRVCRKGGEMLLVADATQDVYGTASSWTDEAMQGAGFSGPWVELATSYRLPESAIPFIRSFAETFLPASRRDLPDAPQTSLALHPCDLRWVQTSPSNSVAVCIEEIMRVMGIEQPSVTSIADIVLLSATRKSGLEVVKGLTRRGIQVHHTFDADGREERRRKLAFYKGDARIKATTLHSFKGWESRSIALYIDHAQSHRDYALIYSGLTRVKRSTRGSQLVVICAEPTLYNYGRSWPDFSVAGSKRT